MVFFTCNACGEALKKNQVEKHTYQCRRCESLSCADCGKDFWGNDYQQHVKCVSEAEKYGGKNFKPKANANKGEQKQNLWVQQVQRAVENCNANPRVRSILQMLVDYPNIPRKEAKFKNFLSNSLRVNDSRLAQTTWDCISTELKKDEEQKPTANGSHKKETAAADDEAKDDVVEENGGSETAAEQKTLNKCERKEERRKKAHREEKKDAKHATNGDANSDEESVAAAAKAAEKKTKKRKRGNDDDDEDNEDSAADSKRHKNGNSAVDEQEDAADEEEEEAAAPKSSKFHWNSVLVRIVTEAGGEIKLKKLQRKVLAQYNEQGGDPRDASGNAALAKLTKKLAKHRRLKVENNSVCLVETS